MKLPRRALCMSALVASLAATSPLAAQDLDEELLSNLEYREIGPTRQSGRFVDIAVPSQQPYTYYLATASGHLWKTTNNGISFDVLFQHEDVFSIGAIAVAPSDPSILYLGSGEANNSRSSYWGDGVYKSTDEGKTWTPPRELPASLTGDRHTGKYAPDGRLFISFRDTTHESPTKGDWVAWVGTWEDSVEGREGQYRVRLKDNHVRGDCAYPGVEVLPDGTFVVTTYGHWDEGAEPYILSVRLTLEELDALARDRDPD